MHHEADGDQIVVEVIEERAAAGAIVERPAERVLHQAGLVLFRRDLPELFQADAEFLRLAVFVEIESCDQLSWPRLPRAPSANSVYLARSSMPRVKLVLRLAVLADAHVAGGDAGDRAILVDRELRPRQSPDRFRRRALRPWSPASGRPCRARRCSCRDCSSAAAS